MKQNKSLCQKDKEHVDNMILREYLTGKYTTIELGNKFGRNHTTVSQIITRHFKKTSRIYGASDSR